MDEPKPGANWQGWAVAAFAVAVLAFGSAAVCAGFGSVAVFDPTADSFAVRSLLPIGILAIVASVAFFAAGRRRRP